MPKISRADWDTKRLFDILSSLCLLYALGPLMLCIAVLIRVNTKGPAIYWSNRIGKSNHLFRMPKFRTMQLGAPTVATHLLKDPDQWVTPVGKKLRRLSLDELPQIYSVFKGDMSFVGPRPALFNQDDLVALRAEKGIQRLLPGITGWAQVNGRDDLPIPVKVRYEEEYLKRRSFAFDLRILAVTVLQILGGKGVAH